MRPLRRPGSPRCSGYSMVELLVASTFLTLGITATLAVHTSANSLRRTAAETRAATAVLGNFIEAVRPLTAEEVAAEYPEGAPIDAGEPMLDGGLVTFAHNGYVAGDTRLELSVTATWTTFRGDRRSLTFDTVF